MCVCLELCTAVYELVLPAHRQKGKTYNIVGCSFYFGRTRSEILLGPNSTRVLRLRDTCAALFDFAPNPRLPCSVPAFMLSV